MRAQQIPAGRLREHIASLSDDVRTRTAVKSGCGSFADEIVQTWPNRAAMAKAIRIQQRSIANARMWRAVVALGQSEGY